jgi:hypothetical protein
MEFWNEGFKAIRSFMICGVGEISKIKISSRFAPSIPLFRHSRIPFGLNTPLRGEIEAGPSAVDFLP